MKFSIIYTKTDEAPALASQSLLPIIRKFTKSSGILIESRDISLAGRILAAFPDYLSDEQKTPDTLGELGELVKLPEANIIKLPNISASIPQLKEAVKELQRKGYKNLPDYPENPENNNEQEIKDRYDKIKGSAVNPVLREGNSDRRAPQAVKEYAGNNPHSMGSWSPDSKSHVASMSDGDFFGTEKSIEIRKDVDVKIEFIGINGNRVILKEKTSLLTGEIIDASVMNRKALHAFFKEQMADAKAKKILFSIHLKATMMKISDPVIFGIAVSVFFDKIFKKHASLFDDLEINPNMGIQDIINKISALPDSIRMEIENDINSCYSEGPELAMVNSDKGITNLHVPSDVIIDASMPAAIRSSGRMYDSDGNLRDIKAVIPDRSYSGIYQETINFCKEFGAFDPRKMGSVSNVGLMAQKAEEYGSHDKTFQMTEDGKVHIINTEGEILIEQPVCHGDIFRMCQVKDGPIQDWIKLAVKRAKATGYPAVFWLDKNRAHDAEIIKKVKKYLPEYDNSGLDIQILSPAAAARFSLETIKRGENTISVTGNVLRDYLTDLFPILELGTSAKMLSIVPLIFGGGLFETGAGGSAPKHVEQFLAEGHLRWDSLGEFLALAVSLEHLASTGNSAKARILSKTLDTATGKLLKNHKSPSRKTGEIDNRGSHFYLAVYWAQALAEQREDLELQTEFSLLSEQLNKNEDEINKELINSQGKAIDLGGYYAPDEKSVSKAMRPSKIFNNILNETA